MSSAQLVILGKLEEEAYTILKMEGASGSIPLPPTIYIKYSTMIIRRAVARVSRHESSS